MPTHVYQPPQPVTWLGRLLVHPLDTAVAVIAVSMSAVITLSLIFPEFIPSSTLERMPAVISILAAALLGGGGVAAIIGLNWTGDNISTGWELERWSWLAAAGGFITFGISASYQYKDSVFLWLPPMILALGAVLRAASVFLIELGVRRSKRAFERKAAHE